MAGATRSFDTAPCADDPPPAAAVEAITALPLKFPTGHGMPIVAGGR